MNQGMQIIRIVFWAIVLLLSLTNQMMLAMDLMAIGMLLEAITYFIHHSKPGTH